MWAKLCGKGRVVDSFGIAVFGAAGKIGAVILRVFSWLWGLDGHPELGLWEFRL